MVGQPISTSPDTLTDSHRCYTSARGRGLLPTRFPCGQLGSRNGGTRQSSHGDATARAGFPVSSFCSTDLIRGKHTTDPTFKDRARTWRRLASKGPQQCELTNTHLELVAGGFFRRLNTNNWHCTIPFLPIPYPSLHILASICINAHTRTYPLYLFTFKYRH